MIQEEIDMKKFLLALTTTMLIGVFSVTPVFAETILGIVVHPDGSMNADILRGDEVSAS